MDCNCDVELERNLFRKLFCCGVEGILTYAKQNTSIFEGILTPEGISTYAKDMLAQSRAY